MSTKPRIFTADFKRESAMLVVDKGYSVSEACRAMGVGSTAMRRWVDQLKTERAGITPKGKAITAEQQNIQALEKRIQQLEWEKDILKKATALLMSNEMRHMR
jgi:transposase